MFRSKHYEQFSIQALQLTDAFIVLLSFWIADRSRQWMRPFFGLEEMGQIGLFQIAWLLFIVVPFTPLILELFGFYKNIMRKTFVTSINQVLRSFALIALLVGGMVIFFHMSASSRMVLITAFSLSIVLLLIRNAVMRSLLKKSAREDGNKERVVIAGDPKEIEELLKTLSEDVTDYWQVVDEFDISAWNLDELEKILEKHSVQRVIIVARGAVFRQISRVVELCEKQGGEAWVAAGFIRTQVARPTFDNLGGQPMLVLRATPELSWALLVKTAMDRVGAFLFILFTSPLWLFAMIGIRIASPGAPVFFRQDRAGKYGKTFKMWKFRTMVADAEAKLAEVKKEMGNEMSGPVFKLEDDPRVFPFARFLRKWSIDELPQMLNVLNGDMSLVGPRPLPVYEVKEFEKSEHRRRLSVKPGITCTWQAGGRNTITEWEDWVKMDLEYIDNWSLWLDIKILFMTVPAVLLNKGAK
jgi:exopolysaccharide biosynthesis polyprenyl glycosylphosphotransferase